jgi:gluconate 2-dehydrogenase alpha chain
MDAGYHHRLIERVNIEMSTVIQEEPADVVVLGLGTVGGLVATEMAVNGYSVVGIEKGPYWNYLTDFAPTKYDEWGIGLMHKFDHPLPLWTYSIRNNSDQYALPSRRFTFPTGFAAWGHGVGGAAQHYAGGFGRYAPWAYQMYSSTVSRYGQDFLNAIEPNLDMQDWPMSYIDYVPYYQRFEDVWGVAGTNQEPFIPFYGYNFPMQPHPTTPLGSLFQSTTESMGSTPYPSVSALASEAYTNPYGVVVNACVYDGWCGAECNYQCEVGAKANSAFRGISAAIKSGNFTMQTDSYAYRFDTDATTGNITDVRYYDLQGNTHVQPGTVFVDALSWFSVPRLMLISGVGNAYNPTTVTGSVGRGLSWSAAAGTAGASGVLNMGYNAYPAGNASGGGYNILDWADDNFDHTGLNFIGGGSMGTGTYHGSGPNNLGIANSASAANIGSAYKAAQKNAYLPTKTGVGLSAAATTLPLTSYYYDLDPHHVDLYGDPIARVTFDNDKNAYNSASYLAPKAAAILTKMGCTGVTTTGSTFTHITCISDVHIRGGCRSGADSSSSVLNAYQQSWTAPNLFAGGECSNMTGDSITAGTHAFGPTAYVMADGIRMYLTSPGGLVTSSSSSSSSSST